MDLGIDVDELYSLADTLKTAAENLSEPASSEDVAYYLKEVRDVLEDSGPEWLWGARKAVQDFASSLAG